MPRRTTAAPKHRAAHRSAASRSGVTRRVGLALAATGAALATTGAASGVLPLGTAGIESPQEPSAAELRAAVPAVSPATAAALRDRGEPRVSRSDRRPAVDPRKAALLRSETQSGGQASGTEEVAGGDPRTIAQVLLPAYGFSSDQFGCLDALWTKESGWDVYADNPTSSAYGIPQSLPGSKMASAGADWATNPATQIRWGLGYIQDSYGSPCSAWAHSQANNWY